MAFSTIDKSSLYQNNVLYTGNNTGQSITGVGFQPDVMWNKSRDNTEEHNLWDIVRGTTKGLVPNGSGGESTWATGLTSFDSDGWTMGSLDSMNDGSIDFAAWCWKAGGTGSANTVGDIASTVSVNTTAGFSIVNFDLTSAGAVTATVGHGLGIAPKMIITKPLGSISWHTWHTGIGTDYVSLNQINAKANSGNFLNNEAPTTTTFKVGDTSNGTFWNNNDCMAYCFAEISGYSKFSTYEGNGNADGTFVYTGFRPSWLMVKPVDSADNWVMFDNKRLDGINTATSPYSFYTNQNYAETTDTGQLDFLSNGFKIRNSGNTVNRTSTFIYAAFGQPIISNGGVCATAR